MRREAFAEDHASVAQACRVWSRDRWQPTIHTYIPQSHTFTCNAQDSKVPHYETLIMERRAEGVFTLYP